MFESVYNPTNILQNIQHISLFHDLALSNDWQIIFPIYSDDNEIWYKVPSSIYAQRAIMYPISLSHIIYCTALEKVEIIDITFTKETLILHQCLVNIYILKCYFMLKSWCWINVWSMYRFLCSFDVEIMALNQCQIDVLSSMSTIFTLKR